MDDDLQRLDMWHLRRDRAGAADPDQTGFMERLGVHLERLDALGVGYRPLDGPHPWQRGGSGHRRRRKDAQAW